MFSAQISAENYSCHQNDLQGVCINTYGNHLLLEGLWLWIEIDSFLCLLSSSFPAFRVWPVHFISELSSQMKNILLHLHLYSYCRLNLLTTTTSRAEKTTEGNGSEKVGPTSSFPSLSLSDDEQACKFFVRGRKAMVLSLSACSTGGCHLTVTLFWPTYLLLLIRLISIDFKIRIICLLKHFSFDLKLTSKYIPFVVTL
ncbi:hypothetical protein K1719_021377 [Acacia pycnantha]|nr:hypothetical protein K1719_021377 [Acacia pycnantha]